MDNHNDTTPAENTSKISADLRGETMAFALQSAFFNLGANFFEPYINYRVQKHFSHNDPSHTGNYSQNLAGEFAGDVVGASTLMLAEALFPKELHSITRTARNWIDPFYSSVAHNIFAKEKASANYDARINEWKLFQERNLVRSTIIASAGLIGNIATQKWLAGNPSPTRVIFLGKLASTALTTAIGLAARLAYPEQMKGIDKWVSKTVFKPWLEDETPSEQAPQSHTDKLIQQDRSQSIRPL